jgi:hypothetical protein
LEKYVGTNFFNFKNRKIKIFFFQTVFLSKDKYSPFLKQILKEDYGQNKPTNHQAGLGADILSYSMAFFPWTREYASPVQ